MKCRNQTQNLNDHKAGNLKLCANILDKTLTTPKMTAEKLFV